MSRRSATLARPVAVTVTGAGEQPNGVSLDGPRPTGPAEQADRRTESNQWLTNGRTSPTRAPPPKRLRDAQPVERSLRSAVASHTKSTASPWLPQHVAECGNGKKQQESSRFRMTAARRRQNAGTRASRSNGQPSGGPLSLVRMRKSGLTAASQKKKQERREFERGNVSTNSDKDLHRPLERGAAVGAAVQSEGRRCEESDATAGWVAANSLLEELARLWPKLSPEQQRQVLAFARRLVERATQRVRPAPLAGLSVSPRPGGKHPLLSNLSTLPRFHRPGWPLTDCRSQPPRTARATHHSPARGRRVASEASRVRTCPRKPPHAWFPQANGASSALQAPVGGEGTELGRPSSPISPARRADSIMLATNDIPDLRFDKALAPKPVEVSSVQTARSASPRPTVRRNRLQALAVAPSRGVQVNPAGGAEPRGGPATQLDVVA